MLRAEHRGVAGAQELFKYRRDEGGFTGWLAKRLPRLPQSSAYQAIEIFKGVSEEMFLNFGNIRPGALAEVAKAEPDIQAIIAERVQAGEIFTAAKVKEIRKEAAREAAEQEADAAEIRMRATRRLDQMRQAQKATVGLSKGGRPAPETGFSNNPVIPTLSEAGIEKIVRRLADEYDAAQERGEVAKDGRSKTVPDGNGIPSAADVGLSRKDVHEARLRGRRRQNDTGDIASHPLWKLSCHDI
ncbi:hypothetical protein ACC738_22570 [Rhizobium ruizarguesonis]